MKPLNEKLKPPESCENAFYFKLVIIILTVSILTVYRNNYCCLKKLLTNSQPSLHFIVLSFIIFLTDTKIVIFLSPRLLIN